MQRYKSQFNYFGKTGFILIIGVLAVILAISIPINYNNLEQREKLFLLYGGPFLLIALIFIWRKILTEMNQIMVTDKSISITNLISKKKQLIDKSDLLGFKESLTFIGGYKILLINNKNEVTAKINDTYYKDFSILINNLELKQINHKLKLDE